MSHSEKIVAVIPAYNEGKTIGTVVRGLLPYASAIVVVDDHSSDNTGEEARRAGATVLRNDPNKGYDGAINEGFKEAVRLGADIIFTFDADGEHDAKDVPRLLAPIFAGTADIVLSQRPGSRHWGEWIFALYTRLRFNIPDPLSGMKAYRRSVYDAIGFFDSLHSIGTELSIRGIKKGFRTALVPITLHERSAGDHSRFYALNLKGNLKMLRALWRILFI
ncbi:glycosyltransferase family 2 protein [Candidatus Kaiserbacteria bacterium]|nr:glycosyltransferase family 2 protein [Candidatus Kaiserbacteria bacterium]